MGREAKQRLEELELEVSRLRTDLRRAETERDFARRQAQIWEVEANETLTALQASRAREAVCAWPAKA